MPPYVWSRTFNDIAEVTNQWRDGEAGALVIWAMWRVDGLHYLADLDKELFVTRKDFLGFGSDVIDIAHVAWAMSTAISALDLCAAALGRKWCATPRGIKELSVRSFDPTITGDPEVPNRRAALPKAALAWVDAVMSDQGYRTALRIRNPFTHARLKRLVALGGRTSFSRTAGKDHIGTRDLIELSKDLATRHVEAFIEAAVVGAL